MNNEETYLEAFVEQFTTSQFTYQLRRTLDLLRDLDTTGQIDLREAQALSEAFLGHVEQKVRQSLQVVVVSTTPSDHEEPDRKRPRCGVRVISSDSNSNNQIEDPPEIPTTEELLEYVMQDHRSTYRSILELQQTCRQKAEEKVQIAQQAYELVDAQVQRLDHDVRAMEQLLQVRCCIGMRDFFFMCTIVGTPLRCLSFSRLFFQSTGEFPTSGAGVTAKPNDLAACQVTPGASEWILAKVLQHDPASGTYQLSDEDVESNKSTFLAMRALECHLYRSLTIAWQSLICPSPKSSSCRLWNDCRKATRSTPSIRTRRPFIRRRWYSRRRSARHPWCWCILSTTPTNSG